MATAFAALVSLQNNLLLIYNHPRHSFSFEKEQIDSLWESVFLLIEFMESFDDSHGAIKEAAEALERQIARAAHAAEDILESHVVDQIRGGSTLGGKTKPRFLLDLQKAIDDMDFVRRKAVNVQNWRSGFKAEQPTISAATSSTPMASEKNRMVGFDDELLRLLELLTGVPSSRRVIPIVGMGGIGKTTLAQNAFTHPYIVQYFDVCLWATVSQEYNVQKILTELVSQIREKTSFLSKLSTSVGSVDELGHELYKSLFGRRYLIILDDVWSVGIWDKIKVFFPDTRNGSRIVVTTRQSDVASDLGSLHLDVGFLDVDSSWHLFCKNAFAEQCCPPELEDIGKKIVGKCGGLPLAIVVAGGHLRKSLRTTEYWENVVNNMVSVLDFGENEQCMNILSLSYKHLPIHLKPCFLFFGVFPEDQEIPMSDIVNLWIAEGFIEEYVNSSLEDIAFKYLVDLNERNLISFYKSLAEHGVIYVCRVHDLIRELCLRIAKKEEFLSVFDTRRAINMRHRVLIKRIILEVDHQQKIFNAPRSEPLVRSLICEGQLSVDSKLLRVLNKVKKASMMEVDFWQVNLRYLKVDIALKSYLPSSISLLWNLQTLIITGVFLSIIAPYQFWEMLQLRHIEVDPINLLDPLPVDSLDQENDLVLRNLHTLSKVENFRLSEEVCRRIPNIEKLELSYCDEPSSYYCLQNLGCFQKLKKLECYFDGSPKWRDFALSLTFPSSLTQLSLSDCRLDWEDLTTMVGSLPYLETLHLFSYSVTGSVWTAGEGGFPCLEMLCIVGDHDLIYWNAEKFHFPVLKYLFLENLSKLDQIPSGIGEIPTLQLIGLEYCSMSSSLSAMRMMVEQEEQGNEELQLQVTFRGDEETLEGFKQNVEEEGLRSKNIHLKLKNV